MKKKVTPKRSKSSSKKRSTGVAPGYLHGFTPDEQNRLYRQALFLESSVFDGVHFEPKSSVLEVGCGVGAQTEILLRRFPTIRVSGIDASHDQLNRAKKHLRASIASGRAHLQQADALHLPFGEDQFDGAFVCWLLEHVPEPIEILKEVRRTLKSSGTIFCNEVLNSSFYVHPYSPATLQYWFAFNDHQWNLKGDPFVGAKLANYLLEAGFQNVQTRAAVHHYDNRAPKKRAQFIDEWTRLLLSGAPALIQAGRVDESIVRAMTDELSRLKEDPNAVFFYSWIQASGQAF